MFFLYGTIVEEGVPIEQLLTKSNFNVGCDKKNNANKTYLQNAAHNKINGTMFTASQKNTCVNYCSENLNFWESREMCKSRRTVQRHMLLQ